MQETRKYILEILKERGEATVDEIVDDLAIRRGSITPVTVRHHLAKLQEDGLVDSPEIQHRSTPGRPQHVYMLTNQGISFFPNNYQQLAINLVKQIRQHVPDNQVNVIIEGLADTMASEVSGKDYPMVDRLNALAQYLTAHGYEAEWEECKDGYMLHTSNCPYREIADEQDLLCQMDMRLITKILGVIPRMTAQISNGDDRCSYFIRTNT